MVRSSLKKLSIPGLIMLAAAMLLLIVLNFTFINREGIWTFALADKFELLLRIPRFITAAAAGAGMMYNPNDWVEFTSDDDLPF